MALETELATYKAHLDELRPHKGEFVLIHQTTVAGCYPTWEEALQAGYDKFGRPPFLVQEVDAAPEYWPYLPGRVPAAGATFQPKVD